LLYNFLKFRWKMEAVGMYLTNTPASEVPAIHRSTLPPNMTMGLDFLISFSMTFSFMTFFYFGLLAVAPSPLAPGPSSPGPAVPGHPAPDLKLLDLQLLEPQLMDFQLLDLQLQKYNCFLLDN
jgi:hypothetical protein